MSIIISDSFRSIFESHLSEHGVPSSALITHQACFESFIVNPNEMRLFIYADGADHLVSAQPPSKPVTPLLFFIKRTATVLSEDDFNSTIIVDCLTGDILPALLDTLQDVPTLLDMVNAPEALRTEFLCGAEHFLAALTDVVGHADGRLVLRAPSVSEYASPTDRTLVARAETLALTWRAQVQELLATSAVELPDATASARRAGMTARAITALVNSMAGGRRTPTGPAPLAKMPLFEPPPALTTPLEVLAAWRQRGEQLSLALLQIDEPRVTAIVRLLRAANSAYVAPWDTVVAELQVASSTVAVSTRVLEAVCEPCRHILDAGDRATRLTAMGALGEALVGAWATDYFSSAQRFLDLLRHTTNLMLVAGRGLVSTDAVFVGDVITARDDLHSAIQLVDDWMQAAETAFSRISAMVASGTRPACLDLPNSPAPFLPDNLDRPTVFALAEAFKQRCHDLIGICDDQLQFARVATLLRAVQARSAAYLAAHPSARLATLPLELGRSQFSHTDAVDYAQNGAAGAGAVGDEEPGHATASVSEVYGADLDVGGRYCIPAFSGTQGPAMRRSLRDMERSMFRALSRVVASNAHHPLDVSSTAWHGHIAQYKSRLKDLDVVVENLLRQSAEVAPDVAAYARLVLAFENIAVRPGLARAADMRRAALCTRLYNRIHALRSELDSALRKGASTDPVVAAAPTYASRALTAQGIVNRLRPDWAAALPLISPAARATHDYVPDLPLEEQLGIAARALARETGESPSDVCLGRVRDELKVLNARAALLSATREALQSIYSQWLKDATTATNGRPRSLLAIAETQPDGTSPASPGFASAAAELEATISPETLSAMRSALGAPATTDTVITSRIPISPGNDAALQRAVSPNSPGTRPRSPGRPRSPAHPILRPIVTNPIAKLDVWASAPVWASLGFALSTELTAAMATAERDRLMRGRVTDFVASYNAVLTQTFPWERGLFQAKHRALAAAVAPALAPQLSWSSPNLSKFISDARSIANSTLDNLRVFHERREKIMSAIFDIASLIPSDPSRRHPETPDEFITASATQVSAARAIVTRAHNTILDIIDQTYREIFANDGPAIAAEWAALVADVEEQIGSAAALVVRRNAAAFARATGADSVQPAALPPPKFAGDDVDALTLTSLAPLAAAPDIVHPIFALTVVLDADNACPSVTPSITDVASALQTALSQMSSIFADLTPISVQLAERARLERAELAEAIAASLATHLVYQAAMATPTHRFADSTSDAVAGLTATDIVSLFHVSAQHVLADWINRGRLPAFGVRPLAEVVPASATVASIGTPESVIDSILTQPVEYEPVHPISDVLAQDGQAAAAAAATGHAAALLEDGVRHYLISWQRFESLFVHVNELTERANSEINRDIGGTSKMGAMQIDQVVAHTEQLVNHFSSIQNEVLVEEAIADVRFVRLDASALKTQLAKRTQLAAGEVLRRLGARILSDLVESKATLTRVRAALEVDTPKTITELQDFTATIEHAEAITPETAALVPRVRRGVDFLRRADAMIPQQIATLIQEVPALTGQLAASITKAKEFAKRARTTLRECAAAEIQAATRDVATIREEWRAERPSGQETGLGSARLIISDYESRIDALLARITELEIGLEAFQLPAPRGVRTDLATLASSVALHRELWDMWAALDTNIQTWNATPWTEVSVETMTETTNEWAVALRRSRNNNNMPLHNALGVRIEAIRSILPVIADLKNPDLRTRHWVQISNIFSTALDPTDQTLTYAAFSALPLHEHIDDVAEVSAAASQELRVELGLQSITEAWRTMVLEVVPHLGRNYGMIKGSDDLFDILDEHLGTLASHRADPHSLPFETELATWEQRLSSVSEILELLVSVQRSWAYLAAIFQSADIRTQLPDEAAAFSLVDAGWVRLLTGMHRLHMVLPALTGTDISHKLSDFLLQLNTVQKGLEAFLSVKRSVFPRFFFLSNSDLLDILGKQRDPRCVQPYMRAMFEAVQSVQFVEQPLDEGRASVTATGFVCPNKSVLLFNKPVVCEGAVENWLSSLENAMRTAVQTQTAGAVADATSGRREPGKFLQKWPEQCTLTAGQVIWTAAVHDALTQAAAENVAAQARWKEQSAAQIGVDVEPPKKHSARNQLRLLRRKQMLHLQRLTNLVRTPGISPAIRARTAASITLEVHNRDIVDALGKGGAAAPSDFIWIAQLRHYWLASPGEINGGHVEVRQCTSVFRYAGELVPPGRLVMTPLNDRCYLTLTTALSLHMGGAPQGPAGTGKTETVKDLAKALGLPSLVVNCQEELNPAAMATILHGLCAVGALSVLDEINRLRVEALSVVATQITAIFRALAADHDEVMLNDVRVPIIPTVGIFVTMNPGYAGRSDLPDNFKALFRPMAMVVPDYAMIAEIVLFSEGFQSAPVLARKVTSLYSLARLRLSAQPHYDFGLRAIKSILLMAGTLRRSAPETPENSILTRVCVDMNVPKLVGDDITLFTSLMTDIFPGVDDAPADYAILDQTLPKAFDQAGYRLTPLVQTRAHQLFETMRVRHGVMILGAAGSGKTVLRSMLASALTLAQETAAQMAQGGQITHETQADYGTVETQTIFPSALTLGEMFGEYSAGGEWREGAVAVALREATAGLQQRGARQYIVFDGPVDTLWIESLNTVLDDSRVLTLANGERLVVADRIHFVFETLDLALASPATVSRCGMVHLGGLRVEGERNANGKSQHQNTAIYNGIVGVNDIFESWLTRRAVTAHPAEIQSLRQAAARRLTRTLHEASQCPAGVPLSPLAMLDSTIRIYESLAVPANGIHTQDSPVFLRAQAAGEDVDSTIDRLADLFFAYALLWGAGGSLTSQGRARLEVLVRELDPGTASIVGPHDSLFNFYVDPLRRSWASWVPHVPAWAPLPDISQRQLAASIVPTVDTTKYAHLVTTLARAGSNVILCGPTGAGKSVIVDGVVLPELEMSGISSTSFSLSACTPTTRLYTSMRENLEKRSKGTLSPANGARRLVLAVDQFGLPDVVRGAQPPLEMLRQLVATGALYSPTARIIEQVRDTTVVGLSGLPGPATVLPPRLMRLMTVVNVPAPDTDTLVGIYGTLLKTRFSNLDTAPELALAVAQSAVELHAAVSTHLLPTPTTPHYVFSLRDVARTISGVVRAALPAGDAARETVASIWSHETLRVYGDSLTSDSERKWLTEQISSRLTANFSLTLKQVFTADSSLGETVVRPPLFTSIPAFATAVDAGDDAAADAPGQTAASAVANVLFAQYGAVPSLGALRATVEELLTEYNATHPPLDLVIFVRALEILCRIHRALTMPAGNLVLAGVAGAGRQSLTRFAAYLAGAELFEPARGRVYQHSEFREDIKRLIRQAGVDDRQICFLISDSVISDVILEEIVACTVGGDIPGIFDSDEVTQITDAVRVAARASGYQNTHHSLITFFRRRVHDNLHFVVSVDPYSPNYRRRLHAFPQLTATCQTMWIGEWPRDALLEVATRETQSIRIGADASTADTRVRGTIARALAQIHGAAVSVAAAASSDQASVYVTPSSFMQLCRLYCDTLGTAQHRLESQLAKYQGGVARLDGAKALVEMMREELDVKRQEVSNNHKEAEELLQVIIAERRTADLRQRTIADLQVRLAEEERVLLIDAAAAQKDLDKAMPALERANDALGTLNRKDIAEIRAFSSPPPLVQKVLNAVMLLKGVTQSWDEAKRQLSNTDFLQSLIIFDKDNISDSMLKKLSRFVHDREFTPDIIGRVSLAAKSLCQWVLAIEEYARVFRVVAPKQAAVELAEKALEQKRQALVDAEDELAAIQLKVSQLRRKYESATAAKERLKAESAALEARLGRANRLVQNLGGERERWTAQIEKLGIQLQHVIGDAVLAAAFLVYAGPLPSAYRQRFMESCKEVVQSLEIESSGAHFRPAQFLASEVELRDWQMHGLPLDEYSAENAVVTLRGARWPFLIDPQGQAVRWLRQQLPDAVYIDYAVECVKEPPKRGLPAWVRTLRDAIAQGRVVVLTGIGAEPPAAINSILEKRYSRAGGRSTVTLGDTQVEVSPSFRLVLCTKLRDPQLAPSVFGFCDVANFALVESGLTAQCLAFVVRAERPELEQQKASAVVSGAAMRVKSSELEDQILTLLYETSAEHLLDQPELLNVLESSRVTSSELSKQMVEAEVTEAAIDAARGEYAPAAARAAALYFVLIELNRLSPYYRWSLEYYFNVFSASIAASRPMSPPNDVCGRVTVLNDYHTLALFRAVSRGLFSRHKMLFAWLIATKLADADGDIAPELYDFVLRGVAPNASRSAAPANPAPQWLAPESWRGACELDRIRSFAGLVPHIEQHLNEWRSYLAAPAPEEMQLPGDWSSHVTEFGMLALVRALRPDRLVRAMTIYLKNNLGPEFIEDTSDFTSAIADTVPTVPTLFLLAPGADPAEQLSQYVERHNSSATASEPADARPRDSPRGNVLATTAVAGEIGSSTAGKITFDQLAMGGSNDAAALDAVRIAARTGSWLLLANVHLAPTFPSRMSSLLTTLASTPGAVHSRFRLFVSTAPCDSLSAEFLEASVKITTEAPAGIRANMGRMVGRLTPADFELPASTMPPDTSPAAAAAATTAYQRMLFGLLFMHAILVERRKFGPTLGFRSSYDFSDSDFDVSRALLRQYVGMYPDELPYPSLRYLIAEVQYGGRVTDAWDRALISIYANEIFSPAVATRPRALLSATCPAYAVPEPCNYDTARERISSLPLDDLPEAFGQHVSADVAALCTATSDVLDAAARARPRLHTGTADELADTDDTSAGGLEHATQALLQAVPGDVSAPVHLSDLTEPTDAPVHVVLQQEVETLNTLLALVRHDLTHVHAVSRGTAAPAPNYDALVTSIDTNRVPDHWHAYYPSTRDLATWSNELVARAAQLAAWVATGLPNAVWLGGLSTPAALITAMLQQAARKRHMPVDALTWSFTVTAAQELRDVAPALVPQRGDGFLVSGIRLIGASWDHGRGILSDGTGAPAPMPIVHFMPVEAEPAGALLALSYSTTGECITTMALPAGALAPADWRKRGAAAIL